jgi:hypothetical protein
LGIFGYSSSAVLASSLYGNSSRWSASQTRSLFVCLAHGRKPVKARQHPRVVDDMNMLIWLSEGSAKLDAETHPDPRPASPEKEARPKSIGTSAEKTFLLYPLSSQLTLCAAHYCRLFWHSICVSILFKIFCGLGTCQGVSSASEANIFGRQPKHLTNAHLSRRGGLLTAAVPSCIVLCCLGSLCCLQWWESMGS